jgi:glucuronoarabinoxylan endo-1,4-beta-xylanase
MKSITILLLFLIMVSCNAKLDRPNSEVWELRSLKKTGGHRIVVFGTSPDTDQGPKIVKTDRGKAILFDGIDDRLLVDSNPIGDSKEFTVEVVFKPYPAYDISNAPRFIHIQDPGDTMSKRVMIELRLTQDNKWYLDGFMLTDAGELTLSDSNLTHPVGEWFHVAVTYKDNTFTTFINGIQEESGYVSFKQELINETGKVSIGGRMDQRNYYCGLVKTLKITHSALEPGDFLAGSQQTGSTGDLVQIDLTKVHQTIVGFGCSSGWTSPTMDDSQADVFFTVDKGIGLSLLRMRIAPDGTSLELETAKQAIARGASVWAAPWTPPAEWKDNHDVNNGGHLLPEHHQDWADRLASFAINAAAEGVPLIGISAQNEPGYVPDPPNSWETCEYTPESLTRFVRDFLGPTLAKRGLDLPIIAPETGGWDKFDGFANALVSDSLASAYVEPIATHSYSGSAHLLESVQSSGHQVWQTEYTDLRDNKDTGMGSALIIAAHIHADMVQGNVSAWHHWQFIGAGPYPYSGLIDGKELTRRAWVIGNWSRFVRPGFVRVEATPSPQTGVSVSAFSDPATNRLVIVLVNTGELDLTQDVSIANGTLPATFTVWTTSDALALKQSGSLVVSSDGKFTVILPARSVTTLVSDLPVASRTISFLSNSTNYCTYYTD